MEQFEKWEDKDCPSRDCSAGKAGCTECKDLKEAGWRAALEWVLTQKVQSTEEVLIDEEAIKRELGDT